MSIISIMLLSIVYNSGVPGAVCCVWKPECRLGCSQVLGLRNGRNVFFIKMMSFDRKKPLMVPFQAPSVFPTLHRSTHENEGARAATSTSVDAVPQTSAEGSVDNLVVITHGPDLNLIL